MNGISPFSQNLYIIISLDSVLLKFLIFVQKHRLDLIKKIIIS